MVLFFYFFPAEAYHALLYTASWATLAVGYGLLVPTNIELYDFKRGSSAAHVP